MGGRGSRLASRVNATASGGGGGAGGGAQVNTATPAQQQPQLQQQMPSAQQVQNQNANFPDTDTAGFHKLVGGRQYYQNQALDIDARTVLPDYLDPRTTPGSLYSAAQNMNYAIAHGQQLTGQQQFMYDSIQSAMHNLGQNLTLTRYDHGGALDSILAQSGVTGGRGGLTASQLKQLLVGKTYSDNRILSTSYNDFKHAGANAGTFTSREIKFSYLAKASTQALMPGNGPGGQFGEILLGATGTNGGHNNYKIVDVKYSGASARVKGGSVGSGGLKQIEIVVEVD